jgi:hypothetical protein
MEMREFFSSSRRWQALALIPDLLTASLTAEPSAHCACFNVTDGYRSLDGPTSQVCGRSACGGERFGKRVRE